MGRNGFIVLFALVGILALNGCGVRSSNQSVIYERIERPSEPVPEKGVSNFVWEEPMVDVVEVPPGLDPEGNYYRPNHQTVTEIRQGRWKYVGEDQVDD